MGRGGALHSGALHSGALHSGALHRGARRLLLCAALGVALAAPAQAQQLLRLSFLEEPPRPAGSGARSPGEDAAPDRLRSWSTRPGLPVRELTVSAGHRVVLRRESGSRYRAIPGAWRWVQVEELPQSASAVAITPALEAGFVNLQVSVHRRDGNELLDTATVITGEPGRWIQVLGPEYRPRGNTRVYSSLAASAAPLPLGLYVKVDML